MNRFFPLVGILLLLIPGVSSAGMAVSDAVTHTYLSQILSTEAETKMQAIKNVEEALKRNETLWKQYEAMIGKYDMAKGLADDIMEVKGFLDSTRSSILGRFGELSLLYQDLSDSEKAMETINAFLDDAFMDPRTTDPVELRKLVDKQFDLRQLGWKNVAEKADELLESMGKRMDKVQDLSGQIDSTANLKESQDLTNRLLVEILLVLQEQLAMSTQYQQAVVADNYQGVTEESIAARQAKLRSLETDISKYRFEVQVVDGLGVNLEDVTAFEIMDQTIKK